MAARYPDKFVVMEPVGEINDPYNPPEYRPMYTGRCRCFLRKPTALRVGSVKDSDFRIVVPDRSMPDVGENYRVCVKMHTNKNNKFWDHVGYVTDFARYDRVCNIDFQMVKENVIYEDIPGEVIDVEKRSLTTVEYEGFFLEGISVAKDRIVKAAGEPITIAVEDDIAGDAGDVLTEICKKNENGEFVVWDVGEHLSYRNNGRSGLIYIPSYTEYEDDDETERENTYYMLAFTKDDEGQYPRYDYYDVVDVEPAFVFKYEVVK